MQGRCCFESGQMKEAQNYLNEAMKSLGYYFPTTVFAIKLKSLILLGYQKIMMNNCLRNFTVGKVEGYSADFSDQLANCLAQLFKLCKVNKTRKLTSNIILILFYSINIRFLNDLNVKSSLLSNLLISCVSPN